MNVFFDTNIILDLVQSRKPFNIAAASLYSFCVDSGFEVITSSLSITNINYILGKQAKKIKPTDTIKIILKNFNCSNLTCEVVNQALQNSQFTDFEDCLQFYMALNENCDCIISRDKKGFIHSSIPVLSPVEFLKKFQ
jgi:predicted nucleic acid-binding protein